MSALAGGLLHPLTVPAHVLTLLALGLLIGQQGKGRVLVPQAVFAVSLAAGLVAIAFAVRQTFAADILLAMAALAGVLVALARPLPALICAMLAAVAGVALGLDSPPQAISLAAGTAILIGTGVGAWLALAFAVAGAGYLRRGWQQIAARILGSWIAASATLVLALRLARG